MAEYNENQMQNLIEGGLEQQQAEWEEHTKIAEALQDDSLKLVTKLKEHFLKQGKDFSHQDGINVWLYGKLAEYEIRLQKIESLLNP